MRSFHILIFRQGNLSPQAFIPLGTEAPEGEGVEMDLLKFKSLYLLLLDASTLSRPWLVGHERG